MKRFFTAVLIYALAVAMPAACFADFQYTETSKATGGSLLGAMKVVGVFSKGARINQPMTSKTSIKGNKMRRESDQGVTEIYDLGARRVVTIDDKHKTYSIVTFDEMKAAMEQQRQKAEKHNKSGSAQPRQYGMPGSRRDWRFGRRLRFRGWQKRRFTHCSSASIAS